ncbi:MAG TPA: hypothetical protein VFC73_07730 [Syntrophomonadaceae bacterium]|nr:hypothetical protein [Syntrophomonadaceae bacterium]
MIKFVSQPSTCDCGSGLSYNNCCGRHDECRVIHFPWGEKNQYKNLIDVVLADLISYVKAYYYNYKDAALTKFVSLANYGELDEEFSPLFWHWYVLNFRLYKDISPAIDFYLSEKQEMIDDKKTLVLEGLKDSYLSLYKVKWVNNNTVSLQDAWLGHEYNVERSFGEITSQITAGSLLVTRLVTIGKSTMLVGEAIIVQSEHLNYLLEEMETVRIDEGIADRQVFLHESGEVLTSLVLDLKHSIKKNRIKAKSILINKSDYRTILKMIPAQNGFSVIEKNKTWLKITCHNKKSFNRIYFFQNSIIIFAETMEDINDIINSVNLAKYKVFAEWVDGFSLIGEEEAEEVLLEIMYDKNLEDWLNLPHSELDNMTPIQAMADSKGRILLDGVLDKLELLELKLKSRNEYYVPTDIIRNRLKLDKNQFKKELLHPDAIAIKVSRNRLHQEPSPFVNAYNWFNEEHRKISVLAFDWLYSEANNREKLAWMLFMWNEYSNLYHPVISLNKAVLAALEHVYLELNGARVSFSWSSKKHGISTGSISKNAQLLLKHFKQYPLNFAIKITQYPKWSELDDTEKMKAYDEVFQNLQLFTYAIKKNWDKDEDWGRTEFYNVTNEKQRFWNKETRKTFDEFFKYHHMLDFQNGNKLTITNMFWEKQAKRFPSYLKNAAFNIMMSYVGVYRIFPEGNSNLIFEDYFTGKTYKVYGNYGMNVHENIVPGMLGITRLLPVGKRLWVNDPMYIVLPDLISTFEKNLQILLEEFHPFDPTDFQYMKKRGEMAVKAYILSMSELEKSAISLMNQPLRIDWRIAGIINYDLIISLLSKSKHLKIINQTADLTTFLWMSFNLNQHYQWGYVIVSRENILITTPPGKDLQKLKKHLRLALKNEDIVIAFRLWQPSLPKLKTVQYSLVSDLAEFFDNNPKLSLALLRQDKLYDEEIEWQQGIFLLQLGSLLMDYLDTSKRHP